MKKLEIKNNSHPGYLFDLNHIALNFVMLAAKVEVETRHS